jgi:hypothetical protein
MVPATELQEFHQEFFQDVLADASAKGAFIEDAFFDLFCEDLIEEGEFDTADRVPYVSRGLRVDGYGGDPRESDGVLSIIVADCNQSETVETLTQTDMATAFKRAYKFVDQSRDSSFRGGLDETSPEFGLAHTIAARWPDIAQVRLIMITNRVLSRKVDGHPDQAIDSIPVTHSVWDLSRLWQRKSSGRAREDIVIDLETDYGGALPVLPAHLDGADYEAYLLVFPGSQLAAIYSRWRARLLEQNVRVFLQARSGVNKGIRNTIENDPAMFFAYNNGVTATAEAVELVQDDGPPRVARFRNLQIVNGGQTTASLHAGLRKKVDLSHIFVQMKLAIVPPERTLEVVPNISLCANSQNKVSAADFFANHPFHIRMEEFSRRIFAPSPDGTFTQTKWFYERARGQHQDARSHLTASKQKAFDLEYPKSQVFTKTDLAKYEMVWERAPHIVSKGAQKNFAAYAMAVGKQWESKSDVFNENYFKRAIARAIVFKEVEKMVTAQPWYEGGYRANVVAYAIAKVSQAAHDREQHVDFERIWLTQSVSPPLMDALTIAAKMAHEVITDPPSANQNVTEWAKQQACWDRVETKSIEWSSAWLDALLSAGQHRRREQQAERDQKELNGIEAQTIVVSAGGQTWRDARIWGLERALLSPADDGILAVCAQVPDRLPTDRQCLRAVRILRRLKQEGYTGGPAV